MLILHFFPGSLLLPTAPLPPHTHTGTKKQPSWTVEYVQASLTLF